MKHNVFMSIRGTQTVENRGGGITAHVYTEGGLYDLGFDKPETYVLSRENVLYYSLFAEEFDGEFTFRGLGKGNYSVVDLWTGELLGNVSAKAPTVHLIFKGYKQLKLEKI